MSSQQNNKPVTKDNVALPLPPGWKKLVSEKGPYYWHQDTDRVQWKFPIEEAQEFQRIKNNHGYVNVGRDSNRTENEYDTISHNLLIRHTTAANTTTTTSKTAATTTATAATTKNITAATTTTTTATTKNITAATTTTTAATSTVTITESNATAATSTTPAAVGYYSTVSCSNVSSPVGPAPSVNYTTVSANTKGHQKEVVPPLLPPPREETIDNDTPPPIPARNYSDEDVNDIPPPVPDRSELCHVPLSPPPNPVIKDVLYDEPIVVKKEMVVKKDMVVVKKEKESSPMYDEINELQRTSSSNALMYEEIPNTSTRRAFTLGPVRRSPIKDKITLLPNKLMSPSHSMISPDAYDVINLNTTNSKVMEGEMMVVSRGEPPLPPPRPQMVERGCLTPDVAAIRKAKTLRVASTNDDDHQYDKLSHENREKMKRRSSVGGLCDDNKGEYSRLSNEAILMRSGVTINGSLMYASCSSLAVDEGGGDGPVVPLIHAPNVPTRHVEPRPHLYEDLGTIDKDSDDNDRAVSQPRLISRKITPSDDQTIFHPESVSDEDYQRRLDRLDGHIYPEIDIPAWSPDINPIERGNSSDIKQVIRDSWNVSNKTEHADLPPGWVQEINEQGQVFYWHLPTGNIQYTKPSGRPTNQSSSPSDVGSPLSPNAGGRPTTFGAVYLGSLDVHEDKLVKGKSVQVVLNAFKSLKDGIITDGVIYVGNMKRNDKVHLQVQGLELKWTHGVSGSVIVTQPINRIRVWGVGQDDEREFGYVSRNLTTKRHQCHMFKCDIAATGLIQSMLESHKANFKSDDNTTTTISTTVTTATSSSSNNDDDGDERGSVLVSVPSQAVRDRSISQEQTDDQKVKRLEAVYIGECDVMGSHGIKAINESVMKLSRDKTKWISVYVDVATSHIKIINREDNVTLKEHRIRFLSFLGIAQDDKFCGYVIDHGDNQFVFHGFYCRPNCDRLCLALHSACQSRYQKVIDSSTTPTDEQTDDTNIAPRKKSILKRIGSWKKKEVHEDTSSTKSECQNFVVQFLGSEVVSKSKGVDAVMGPLQKVSMKTSGIHLVELIVTPGGFTINDPQIKSFASKQIPTKKVTFCIRIRSNFVFVAKEGTKHVCYMFKESEVDTASIAQAVHDIMSS